MCEKKQANIYLFLCRTLGDQVAISQVIDLDVLDVVAISGVHFLANRMRLCLSRLPIVSIGGLNWRYIDMLNALSSLERGIDSSGGGSCKGH